MKNERQILIVFLSLILSSCGLIDKFKTPDTPTESTADAKENVPSDDLFSEAALKDSNTTATNNDNPTNLPATESILEPNNNQDELAALQNEFTGSAPNETAVSEVKETAPAIKESAPQIEPELPKVQEKPMMVRDEAPVINTENEDAKITNAGTGEYKEYRVKKGETLMQIAFKLYGDISRWKDLRKLNGDKLSSNSSLKANLSLKYEEPETPFVWNPVGTPYMIQQGETLGIISNNVYQTPKKWKAIWENNKPLIKNPNIIFAGFTIYYKNDGMANYVQPKKMQPKIVSQPSTTNSAEEIKIENALTEIEKLNSNTEEVNYIRSAPQREPASTEESSDIKIPDTKIDSTSTAGSDGEDPVPALDESLEE